MKNTSKEFYRFTSHSEVKYSVHIIGRSYDENFIPSYFPSNHLFS